MKWIGEGKLTGANNVCSIHLNLFLMAQAKNAEEVSYETLAARLSWVDLLLTNLTFSRDAQQKKWRFHIGVSGKSSNDDPTVNNGAMYSGVGAEGSSPDEVVNKIWQIVSTQKLFIGSYSNYHMVVEWQAKDKKFVKRPLTQSEEFQVNDDL